MMVLIAHAEGAEMNQLDFAICKMQEYFSLKGVDCVGVRRLHYFIVSLPEHERQIPGRGKKVRLYQNTPNDYKNLSTLLVDARTTGLIPSDSIIDEKNAEAEYMPARQECQTGLYYEMPDLGFMQDNPIELLPPLEELGIRINPYIQKPAFNNQTHRIVVVIEKATSKDKLKELCQKYGSDLLIFCGQFSLTRVIDVARCAEAEDKPIHLLYISDLDCGGWTMPAAFMGRLQQMYPHEFHRMQRVALTRAQVEKYNLPTAFEPSSKGYSQTQIDNFITESGGDACVELDALDEDVLLNSLEDALQSIAGLEDDYAQCHRNYEDIKDVASEFRDDLDLSILEPAYTEMRQQYNELADEFNAFNFNCGERIGQVNIDKAAMWERIGQHLEARGVRSHSDVFGAKEGCK